jgi:hypothetical protein
MGVQRGSDGEGLQGFARVAAVHNSRSSARRDGEREGKRERERTRRPNRKGRTEKLTCERDPVVMCR